MPGRDGTGPMGMGPLTGRGAGCCTGFAAHKYGHPFAFTRRVGLGCRCGHGRHRGFLGVGWPGWAYCGYPAPDEGEILQAEKEFLQGQITFLEDRLVQLKERLAAIKEKEKEE